jgi:hypothetical protein
MNTNAKIALALAVPGVGLFFGAMMLRGPGAQLGRAQKPKRARYWRRREEREQRALEKMKSRAGTSGRSLYQHAFGGVKVDGEKGKPGFRVSIEDEELDCFRRRWPTGELVGLESVTAEFAHNGDLADVECNGGSCERWDNSALVAVTDDMQCAGESRLGIKDRCHSDEWMHCMRD